MKKTTPSSKEKRKASRPKKSIDEKATESKFGAL